MLGRDTRTSGEKLSNAIISGIIDAGADVINLDIVPTPAVSFVTREIDANYGVMISASHNPPEYNGIKIFMSDGRKLCRIEEAEIEKHIESKRKVVANEKGKVENGAAYFENYVRAVTEIADDLSGLKVVLDCANGALSHVAKHVFESLNATVYSFNDEGCGRIINHECGATDTKFLRQKVKELNADVGFAYDGDADRLIAVDENGREVDGDEIIFIIARELLKKGKLNKKKVVCTVLSNMGVERNLNSMGVSMLRVDVGDHNVQAAMAKGGYVLGGEQSGQCLFIAVAHHPLVGVAARQVKQPLYLRHEKRTRSIAQTRGQERHDLLVFTPLHLMHKPRRIAFEKTAVLILLGPLPEQGLLACADNDTFHGSFTFPRTTVLPLYFPPVTL